MSFIEHRTLSGYSCDGTKCDRQVRGPEMAYFAGMRYYQQLGAERGWTFWAGRARRSYCPDHGPSKGHTMHRLDTPTSPRSTP